MSEIYSRCGFRCDLCPAYYENIKSIESQRAVSKSWLKYFGFEIPPEKVYCDGCLSEKSDPVLLDSKCPVRPCAVLRGLGNCSNCDDYYCSKLMQRAEGYLSALNKFSGEIIQEEYDLFIKSFEGKKNLELLRDKSFMD
jgi:hypothetical protein